MLLKEHYYCQNPELGKAAQDHWLLTMFPDFQSPASNYGTSAFRLRHLVCATNEEAGNVEESNMTKLDINEHCEEQTSFNIVRHAK